MRRGGGRVQRTGSFCGPFSRPLPLRPAATSQRRERVDLLRSICQAYARYCCLSNEASPWLYLGSQNTVTHTPSLRPLTCGSASKRKDKHTPISYPVFGSHISNRPPRHLVARPGGEGKAKAGRSSIRRGRYHNLRPPFLPQQDPQDPQDSADNSSLQESPTMNRSSQVRGTTAHPSSYPIYL